MSYHCDQCQNSYMSLKTQIDLWNSRKIQPKAFGEDKKDIIVSSFYQHPDQKTRNQKKFTKTSELFELKDLLSRNKT